MKQLEAIIYFQVSQSPIIFYMNLFIDLCPSLFTLTKKRIMIYHLYLPA